MRQETKTIYAAIDYGENALCTEPEPEISMPSIGTTSHEQIELPVEASTSLSYRQLTKCAREIMTLNAFNFNSLFQQQNLSFPTIEETKFIEFQFGSNQLIGTFKAKIANDKKNSFDETTVHAAWNSSSSLYVF